VWRRLRRNRIAMASLAVFVAIVACCVRGAAVGTRLPTSAGREQPDRHLRARRKSGSTSYAAPAETQPVGPGWSGRYLLGADKNGRDEMVRLLYGGRNSLFVGFTSALITTAIAVMLGLAGGYFRGRTDLIAAHDVRRDLVLPGAVCSPSRLGRRSPSGGLHLGPVDIEGGSLWIPILVIGIILHPYLGARCAAGALAAREGVRDRGLPVARATGRCGSCSPSSCPTSRPPSSCSAR